MRNKDIGEVEEWYNITGRLPKLMQKKQFEEVKKLTKGEKMSMQSEMDGAMSVLGVVFVVLLIILFVWIIFSSIYTVINIF